MNKKQRIILRIAYGLAILVGLFPPWIVERGSGSYTSETRQIAFILAPMAPPAIDRSSDTPQQQQPSLRQVLVTPLYHQASPDVKRQLWQQLDPKWGELSPEAQDLLIASDLAYWQRRFKLEQPPPLTLREILTSPVFHQAPQETRRALWIEVDPKFGVLPKPDQDSLLGCDLAYWQNHFKAEQRPSPFKRALQSFWRGISGLFQLRTPQPVKHVSLDFQTLILSWMLLGAVAFGMYRWLATK